MKNYIIKILILTSIIGAIGAIIFSMVTPQFYLPVFPWVLLFFVICSVAIHAWQIQLSKSDMGKFTRGSMILTFVRLLLYSAFAIIYIAADTQNAKIFVVVFLSLYLVFAAFEVILIGGFTARKK